MELLHQLRAAVVVTDPDGRISAWNDAAERLFGWRREEALGHSLSELIDLPGAPALAKDRLGTRELSEGEVPARHRDGSRLELFITESPLVDDGRRVGTLRVAVDVSRHVRQEADLADLLAREQAARAEAELLNGVAMAAAGENDLHRILAVVLERLAGQVRFTGGSIALIEGDELVVRAAIGPFAEAALGSSLPRGRGRTWQVIETRQPFRSDDLRADGIRIVTEGAAKVDIHSYLAVPLVWRDLAIGLLEVDSTQPGAFDAADQRLVQRVAVALSGPVELARRHAAEAAARLVAERAAQRTARLQATTAALAGAVTSQEVAAAMTQPALLDALGASAGSVALLNEAGDALEVVRSVGYSTEVAERFRVLPLQGDTPLAVAARTRQPVLVGSVELLRRSYERLAPEAAKTGNRAIAAYPLLSGERVLGAMGLSYATEQTFDDDEQAYLLAVAQQCSQALERARLNDAELEAHRELSRFKATLDATLDSVFMFDPGTLRHIYANQGAVDSLGYAREELLAMTPLDLKLELDEDRYRALLDPLIDGREPFTTLNTNHWRKDGTSFPVEVSLQYVAPAGEPPRIVAIARDITDRVEARARLQRLAQSERALSAELKAIIRAMGEAVLVFAPDRRLIFSNPAAEALFAERPIASYQDVASHIAEPGQLPRLGEPHGQGPVELRTTDEEERWLEASAYPVAAPLESIAESGDEPAGLETILFLRDVTAARQARQARDAFIGVLSHELRTPVTTIYGNSKLLGRSEERPEDVQREIFADIETEAERLYRLVEDLLVLARFGDEDQHEPGNEPLLLQRIVPAVVRSEQGRWPRTEIDQQVEAALPAAKGEQTYVEQVIRNLVSNAAKYSGPGARVEVFARGVEEEVVVTVLDEGPGFPAEERGRLFELFYRSPGTASRATGAGIGLFVCKRLIEAMGGRIWARPRAERGSEFGFALKVFNEEET